jgi:hypothetical protein
MFEMRYPAEISQHPEGKDWVVKFPDLQGTNTGLPIRLTKLLARQATALGRISPC